MKRDDCFWKRTAGWLTIAVGILLLITCMPVPAQTTQATILGTVKSAAGAPIAGAKVILLNIDENATRAVVTDSSGSYRFQDVKVAHYIVRVTATGFDTWAMTGVQPIPRQVLRLDATLQPGEMQQEIRVTDESLGVIETIVPTISGTFSTEAASQLPVNTRASFSGTSPAGILGSMSGMQSDSSGMSLQGALPWESDVTVDGVSVKAVQGSTSGYLSDSFPSSESIDQMRDDGALVTAEYGDPGQVLVTTKAGTNMWHGSGFWYYQNSAFNAIAYTYPKTTTKPSLTGNTFGGSVGGPVTIPHFYNGHDKSFFHFTYEGWRHPSQTTKTYVVPSTEMKNGNFANYLDANGNHITLTNPVTGASYGTTIPSISPIAASFLKQFYPDPNVGNPAQYKDNDVANYVVNKDTSAHSNQIDARGDQYFGSNQKFLLWGKYTQKNFPTNAVLPLNVPSSTSLQNNKAMKIDTNWFLTSNLINEGGFGFTRFTSGVSTPFDGKAWTTAQGFVGLQNLFYNGIPEMDFNHISNLNADRLNSETTSHLYDISDTLMWTHHTHSFKFGAQLDLLRTTTPLGFNGSDNYGTYQFNTNNSNGLFTGLDFADFLLGLPNYTFYDVVSQDNHGIASIFSVFAMDEWRITPKLALSYGLRYELHPPYYDQFGDVGNFDPTVALSGKVIYPAGYEKLLAKGFLQSANACNPDGVNNTNSATVNGAACMQVVTNTAAGLPNGLKSYVKTRFMPRLGFAYQPWPKWAIRGGAGLYNITLMGSNYYSLTGTLQAATQQFTNTYNPATHAIGYQWPAVYNASLAGSNAAYGTDYFGTANTINWKDPYTEQWSLTLDHDLGHGYGLRASYVGEETHQLVWAPDLNTLPFSSTVSAYSQPHSARRFPNWGRVNTRQIGANEKYNSGQVEVNHRMQQGLELNSSLVWAHATADNQGPSGTGFAGETGGSRATSILDRHADFGNVYGIRRIRWSSHALYDLPIGRGMLLGSGMGRTADKLMGGWRMSAILIWQTGPYETPFFPAGQGDPSGTGSGLTSTAAGWDPGRRSQRPDNAVGVNINPTNKDRFHWANPKAFACPGNAAWVPGASCTTGSGSGPVPLPIGRFGNNQVGSVQGPHMFNLSAGLSKTFPITERVKVKAEGTFTNVLNHTNLGDPIMDLSTSSFGLISNTIGSDAGGARTGQISVRAEF